jgi:hypothetical protein
VLVATGAAAAQCSFKSDRATNKALDVSHNATSRWSKKPTDCPLQPAVAT